MTDQSSISDGAKPHLRIDALKQSVRFKGQGATITNKFRRDQREEHGKFLLSQLDQALQQADLDRNALGINQYLSKGGVYVSVERAGGLPVEKLQQKRNHLTVGAVNKVQNRPDHEVVAYFIPDEQRKFLEEQIAFYRDSDGANKPNAVHKRFEEVEEWFARRKASCCKSRMARWATISSICFRGSRRRSRIFSAMSAPIFSCS